MPSIETPLLIVGHGPAALVVAKLVSGAGMACLVAGHQSLEQNDPVELDERSVAVLEPHGVLGVLRPYAASQDPFAIAPQLFENGLKHHCVADMLITVYDAMSVDNIVEGAVGTAAVLSDGRSSWPIAADALLDVANLPTELNAAVHEAADFAVQLLSQARN